MNEMEKKKMLLISHSTADKRYAEALITLFENIGLNQTHMVCSSIPGYGIPLGKDVYEWLASKFTELDLHVVFVLSDRYYSSAPCLNEMGAAWITKSEYTSILLPGFDFSQIRGAINPNQISIKFDSEEDELIHWVNVVMDNLTEKFGITKITDLRWERFRGTFIDAIRGIKTEQESKRIRTNQPAFAIKIEAINEQLPGTADILNADFTGGTKHNNLQFSIEIINERPARNIIVFNKLLTSILKPGEKCGMSVAYEDSEDLRKWPSRVVKILHSEYEEENGIPSWFNICYQDEEGHNMVQSVKLQSYKGDYYYDPDGYPWEA